MSLHFFHRHVIKLSVSTRCTRVHSKILISKVSVGCMYVTMTIKLYNAGEMTDPLCNLILFPKHVHYLFIQ